MAPLGAEPRRSTKLVLAGPSPPCALRGAATEAPTASFIATESKARSAPVGTRHSWRSKLRGDTGSLSSAHAWFCSGELRHRAPQDPPSGYPPLLCPWAWWPRAAVPRSELIMLMQLPGQQFLLLMYLLAFSRHANHVPSSTSPSPSFRESVPASPVVASMVTRCCRSAPACVLLAMAKRRKEFLKEFSQPKLLQGSLKLERWCDALLRSPLERWFALFGHGQSTSSWVGRWDDMR